VGQGKALITLLAPVVLRAFKPVLFVPAKLRDQTELEVIPTMSRHWRLHRNLKIYSYEMLSNPKSVQLFEELAPDLVILDEAHALKNATATRTRRFLSYMKEHRDTKLVALSGTITDKSLFDFWELCKLALPGLKCPMPLHWSVLKEWDAAIGAGTSWAHDEPMDPGALETLCAPGENVRQGFRRRLVETPGVVASSESAIGTSLVITAKNLKVPKHIQEALIDLRKNMRTIWGEEVEDGTSLSRHARQLACGFYYRWDWSKAPGGVPDEEWLWHRSNWHRELRHILKRDVPGCDSPFLVASAIARGDIESEFYEPWCSVRYRYGKEGPPVTTVWIDDFLTGYALRWLDEHEDGIVWYEHTAIGERLAKLGAKVYGSGKAASVGIIDASGPIVASVAAHGTGKNLQRWSDNLVLSCPPSGKTWQQLIARTHRPGQLKDEVCFDVLQHTQELREAWGKALVKAHYLEGVTDRQKLLMATLVDFDLDESRERVRFTG
jgi:hypothetical protein